MEKIANSEVAHDPWTNNLYPGDSICISVGMSALELLDLGM